MVAALHAHGREAVPLLVAELRVVDPDPRITSQELWWHLVWCERALRSITGQRFEFRTEEPLSADLAQFRSKQDSLSYAMEWMSRGAVFIAPRDVQAKVIDSWHSWLLANANTFEVQPYAAYGDWYF